MQKLKNIINPNILDYRYIYNVETNIKQYFKSNKLSADDKSELVVINKNKLEQIKQHYKLLQNSYIGRYQEMNNNIIELEKEIVNLNFQLKLKDKDIELKNKDIELKNKEIDSKDKECKLNIKLLEMKLLLLKDKEYKLNIKLLEMKLLLSKFQ